MSTPWIHRVPRSVVALVGLTLVEGLAVLAQSVSVLVAHGAKGAITGGSLVLAGALFVLTARGLAAGSLGWHKGVVFLQTFLLIAGFSLLGGVPLAGFICILLAAGTLVAGFWPSTRTWFESFDVQP